MDRGRGLTDSKDGKGHESSRFLSQRLMHRPVRRADAQGPARARGRGFAFVRMYFTSHLCGWAVHATVTVLTLKVLPQSARVPCNLLSIFHVYRT